MASKEVSDELGATQHTVADVSRCVIPCELYLMIRPSILGFAGCGRYQLPARRDGEKSL